MERLFFGAFDILGRLMLFGVAVLMAVEAVLRSFFSEFHFIGEEEAARALLVYITMIGGGLAVVSREHFAVPTLVRLLPIGMRRVASLTTAILILAFGAAWTLGALSWVQSSVNAFTPVLEIDLRLIYAALPVGGLIIAAGSLLLLVQQMRTGEPLEFGEVSVESGDQSVST